MLEENQMIHPGKSGDDGDAALDAELAAADEDMLAAISSGLDLDVGLARILKDLGGSSAAPLGIQAQAPADPGRDPGMPDATTSPVRTRGVDAASPIRVARLIHDINASDEAVEDQFLCARRAAGIAARGEYAAEQAAAEAESAQVAHQVIQAGQPHRYSQLPRQVTLAFVTVVLEGVACFLAARALGGSLAATLVWTGLFLGVLAGGVAALGCYGDRSERAWRAVVMLIGFLVILLGTLRFWFLATTGTGRPMPAIASAYLFTVAAAGFLALGYRALRTAETPSAWRARRQATKALQAARLARDAADQNAAERDRLIDTYLGHVRRQAPKMCPAERQLAVESGVRKHLLRERTLGQLEAWRPSSAPLPCRLTGLRTGSWMRRWIPGAVPAPPDA